MKKKIIKFFGVGFAVVFCFMFFVACNPYKEVKKASKGLTNYNISATLNEENMQVEAVETISIVNNTNVILNNLCFNLYARAFREDASVKPFSQYNQAKCFPNGISFGDIIINNVKENNKDANFEYAGVDDNALQVNLSEELEPGDKTQIVIGFTLKLAECCHRLGYLDGSVNLGNWFPILAKYEKGEYVIEPYYSTGDPFYSDIANYEIQFSAPKSYTLASTGKVVNSSEGELNKDYTLTALAVRDFAITLTKEVCVVSEKIDNITINYIGYKEDSNADFCLDVAVKAVEFFNQTFGVYPYEKLDVVKAPFVHGGMEYPSVVLISDTFTEELDIVKVIVHEIAHQWWYAVVGNNEISEAWLDESLAEYSTVLFLEKHQEYGSSYEELVGDAFANYVLYVDIVKTTNKELKTSMLLNVNEYAGDYEYSYMIYVKGVLMFDNIRQLIGEAKLKKSLKTYYEKYKFKIATTDGFIAILKKTSGKDVSGVMDSWLNGKTVIGAI